MSRLYRTARLASLSGLALSSVSKKSVFGDDNASVGATAIVTAGDAKAIMPSQSDAIAVYLNEESIRYLKVKLKKLGYGDYNGNMVVIKSDAKKIDNYIFEPLFGDRVAFRIKGIVEITNEQERGGQDDEGAAAGSSGSRGSSANPSPHKLIACTGRLSSIAGEIKDDDGYIASLPLYHDNDVVVDLDINPDPDHPFHDFNYKHNSRESMDLPSRLATCQEKKFFERSKHLGRSFASQRLRDCEVLGQRYPNATALYKFLEWDEQVVLEGTLCNSRHVCKDGKCGFDRSMMTGISDIFPEAKQKVVAEAPSSSSSSGSSISSSGSSANKELSADDSKKSHAEHKPDEKECPVCAFMKSGQCKSQFVLWDECVQSLSSNEDVKICQRKTVDMMECMQGHEYYDIMTVGTQAKMEKMKELYAELESENKVLQPVGEQQQK